ncbi:MAG: rod shape-determining protein RodA, partial [Sphingopyxis sp.]|nr:rod shape-determining protein RodA [Sphingopyxis sp.]
MIPVPPAIQRIPWKLIALLSAITGFGLLVLYSAAGGSWSPWAWQQGVRFLVFLTFALVIGRFPIKIFEDFAYLGYIAVLVLLIAVELLGFVGGGSQRWLNLGFMNLQPSELMKVAIVLALGRFYAQLPPGETRSWTALWPALVMIGFPAALVMLQPDLGTALAICVSGVVVMFISGLPLWWFGSTAAAGIAALPVLFSFLHDYQQKRVLIFLDPESDPLGAGYHISQSKIAIGSGGVGGKGFLNGSQSHLDYLPEGHTDFIFATMAE